ncbi:MULTISPECIES: Fur-regulated basic protein FbpA [unclassified Sporosarcina]|uniref:Fur-regulated basic protein FbpA n=1 Tax=unclassified Sporosarcina TaxID=2647733 RepID=UPI000C16E348|nr:MULTISPECIES: Fur-regulated basic protein FbpA [unclassified Sporosarcina]PID00983.1 Fur-regulated basic protein FbpA [Sporosarcina sp. P29]PID04922.1 Fur-regulated basic protein FbpA [Sporosarcina sp. P30]PID08182.1 Fur-regulated basic protein FbpA [Sporosarcina sp. P31]PID11262.1 Fur-regulated basic protein FbpA [Sporosarcina sp. P32b]
MKTNKRVCESKRDKMIEELVSKGVFKIDGKQLYELPLQLLMKEYEAFGQTDIQM